MDKRRIDLGQPRPLPVGQMDGMAIKTAGAQQSGSLVSIEVIPCLGE